MENNKERVNFGSKISAILVAAGSAVGLGNIWRFPYEAGSHGGAAFIFVYLICILVMGLPIMLAEFSIGRSARSNVVGAFKKLAPGSAWKYVGYIGITAAFFIFSFYCVVAGWTLEYSWQALTNGFAGMTPTEYSSSFSSFSSDSFRPLLWMVIFMLGTHLVIVMGIQKGIERSARIMMPWLFILIILLAICSVSLPGSEKGLEFLLKPDFSKITPDVMLGAMGQAFFSLSLGLGCLSTYASYFNKETNLTRTAFSVAGIDTFVSIMAGIIIFPAAFSVGISPDAGPSLLFITLPNVFQTAFGGMPVVAYVITLSFYILLVLAALTSTISMHEIVTSFASEEWKISRPKAATVITTGSLFLGALASLSFGPLADVKLFGLTIFDFLDGITSKVMLPLGGMLIAIFVGWKLDRRISREQLSNNGSLRIPLFRFYIFLLKFVAPIAILFIFLKELNII